jgi:hypothetical protein
MKMQSSWWVGKYSSRPKKGMAGQVKRESHDDSFFLTLRVLCIMNSYVRGKQWITSIILKCWNVQEKKTSVLEIQLLVPPSRQCAISCIATDLWHNCASSATLLTWPGSSRLFLIFQTEIHFKRTTISDDSRDYRKFADRATSNPEKGVPRLFRSGNSVGSGAPMQEGSNLKAIRLTQLQEWPKKIIKK